MTIQAGAALGAGKGAHMTITMWCDRCGEEIDEKTNGGVRLRTGNREISMHLCGKHQTRLRALVADFCQDNAPREVSGSLKGTDPRRETK
jgi:uncharacterized protein YlaI